MGLLMAHCRALHFNLLQNKCILWNTTLQNANAEAFCGTQLCKMQMQMQMQKHFVEHNFAKCKCKCILWNTTLQNANANAFCGTQLCKMQMQMQKQCNKNEDLDH